MKKIVFILIALTMLFTACNSNAEPEVKHDFLNVDFGMSTVELLDVEGEPYKEIPPSSDNNISVYWYKYNSVWEMPDVSVTYFVDENGVSSMVAAFSSKYSDNKSYLTEYDTVKKNLISEWGEPIKLVGDEDNFVHICSWGNKFLELYRNEDNSIIFRVSAYRQDYLENNPQVTEAWKTE